MHWQFGPIFLNYINKSVHISFKCKFATSYQVFDTPISHTDSYKDLGINDI